MRVVSACNDPYQDTGCVRNRIIDTKYDIKLSMSCIPAA